MGVSISRHTHLFTFHCAVKQIMDQSHHLRKELNSHSVGSGVRYEIYVIVHIVTLYLSAGSDWTWGWLAVDVPSPKGVVFWVPLCWLDCKPWAPKVGTGLGLTDGKMPMPWEHEEEEEVDVAVLLFGLAVLLVEGVVLFWAAEMGLLELVGFRWVRSEVSKDWAARCEAKNKKEMITESYGKRQSIYLCMSLVLKTYPSRSGTRESKVWAWWRLRCCCWRFLGASHWEVDLLEV